VAINAQIQNPGSTADILVNRSGTITGETGGVLATTEGTGNVTVQGVGTVTTTTGTGILAVSQGGNVLVEPGSTVSGETGISAQTVADGTVGVTVGFDVTGTNGDGRNHLVGHPHRCRRWRHIRQREWGRVRRHRRHPLCGYWNR
jgi:hypothetical protein